jgi:TolB-like protein/tetratricopeptide (TPR) repeat protein
MASIIPGFEYDIFISYRHNDNRSGWVTEFVAALQEELAATLKECVSVYFDTNRHDGLLETHNVDKSLEGKLKCLIFIPIISQTYCDSKSFAWQHEFVAFNKMAREDQFSRDIRLASGNVASRILPIKIHNLDQEDKTILENELGGMLRCIDFIYIEAGVNRPLRPNDDAKGNLNKTQYRNQVNKLANAVKEIMIGARNFDFEKKESPSKNIVSVNTPDLVKAKSFKLRMAFWSFIIIGLLVSGYFVLPSLFKTSTKPIDRSIAVLPLENMSNDPGQEYFSNGMMQEILNHLFMIGGLKIPSGTSSMRFKGSKLSVREIARELGVSFVLEGNVSRSGDNVRIIVRLINGKNEQLLWTEDYNRTMTAIDLFDIQSDVAQKVAESLKIVMNPEVKKRINARPTENTEAYLLFLQATQSMGQHEYVQQLLEKAIVLDPGFADAYAALAFFWLIQGNDLYGKLSREQVLEKTEPLLKKALELDKNSVLAHTYLASIRLWYNWDFESVEKEFRIVNQLNPSSSDAYLEFVQYLIIIGKFDDALNVSKKSFNDYDITGDKYVTMALAYCYSGQQEKALETVETYSNIFQIDNFILYNSMRIYVSLGKYEKVIELFEKNLANKSINDLSDSFLGYLGIAYFKTGRKSRTTEFLNELSSKSLKPSVGSSSYFAAAVYTAMSETDKALQLLQKAYTNHEVEMVWLKVDPLFRTLHGDPRFENLLRKIGFE